MKYKVIAGVAFSLILVLGVFIGTFISRRKTQPLPKAQTAPNITGSWTFNSNLTEPENESWTSTGSLIQQSDGSFSGTLTDTNGNATNMSGQVSGSNFQSNYIQENGSEMGYDYTSQYRYVGTISSNGNQITGTIEGTYTAQGPLGNQSGNLTGNFNATKGSSQSTPTTPPQTTSTPTTPSRTNTPTPTSASGRTNTPTPTSFSNRTNTPTPTGASTNSQSGVTAPPVPSTGTGESKIIGLGAAAILLVLIPIALLF